MFFGMDEGRERTILIAASILAKFAAPGKHRKHNLEETAWSETCQKNSPSIRKELDFQPGKTVSVNLGVTLPGCLFDCGELPPAWAVFKQLFLAHWAWAN